MSAPTNERSGHDDEGAGATRVSERAPMGEGGSGARAGERGAGARVRWAWAAAAALAGAVGCAPPAFSPHARDNNVVDLATALAHAATPARRSGPARAFLVVPDKLVGFDLDGGRVAWEQPADVRSRVVVGSGVIAHRQGDRELVLRSADNGVVKLTTMLQPGETFVGLALDGDRLVYVVQTADKQSAIVALDALGKPLWRIVTSEAVGAPAARGGLVAVPFAHQNLALLDRLSGRELARVRDTDEAIAWVRALPEGIFYGGAGGVYRLDDKSVSGSRAGSSYADAKLPGDEVRSAYSWDGYQPAQAALGAFDRNRLLWRGRDVGAGFRDDLAVLHSYRFFFAFDALGGKLRWVYAHPRTDVVASEDAGQAIVFASADGDLGAIDARSGAVRVVAKTGLRVAGASFDADGFGAGGTAAPPTTAEVAHTLTAIVWDHDARFGAVKRFAIDALGGVPGVEVSAALLQIVRAAPGENGATLSPAVQQRAGEALVARHDRAAASLMLEALRERYDYLDDTQPRGVAVLARALAALDVKEAAPLLAAHLADPATPDGDLRWLVSALGQLGGPDALHALADFLVEYHADVDFAADPAPLTLAAEALLKSTSVEGRRAALLVADDARTLAPVSRQLKAQLQAVGDDGDRQEPQGAPQPLPDAAQPAPGKPQAPQDLRPMSGSPGPGAPTP